MITTMRGCVADSDLWHWPISSRSFGLDLENRVRSVASTVLDGFFLYLAQMITIIRGCVVCYIFFRIWKFEFLANFWNFWALPLKKKSTVLDGFFPYLAQMITNMRGCVAYNDLWPWLISSRSFGLGLENRVRSVASTVLDGFFPYLVQMITRMRRYVACDDLWPWPISSRSFDLDFENRVRSVKFSVLDRLFSYLPQIITTIRGCVACEVYNKIPRFQFFANFFNFSVFTLFWLGIWYELVNSMDLGFKMNWSIVWVIMGRRRVSSERRRSSCFCWKTCDYDIQYLFQNDTVTESKINQHIPVNQNPRAGGGVNIGQLKVCFTRKELVIGPSL